MGMNVDKSQALVETFSHYGVDVGGGRGKVCGPCHDDSVPSVSVNVSRGVWHCFACDVGGDFVELIKYMEGVNFAGARDFAASWGIATGGVGESGGALGGESVGFRWGGRPKLSGRQETVGGRGDRKAGFRWK